MHHRSLLPSVAKPLHLCTIRAEAVVTVVLRIMESLFVLEVCYTSAAKDECKPWSMLQPRVETELWNTILAYFGRKACFGAFITPNSMLSSHVTDIFCEPIQLLDLDNRGKVSLTAEEQHGSGHQQLELDCRCWIVEIGRDWTINVSVEWWILGSWYDIWALNSCILLDPMPVLSGMFA